MANMKIGKYTIMFIYFLNIQEIVFTDPTVNELRYGEFGLQIAQRGPMNTIRWDYITSVDTLGAAIICDDYSNSAFFYQTTSSREVGKTVSIICSGEDNTIGDCDVGEVKGMRTVLNITCLERSNYLDNSLRVLEDNRVVMLQLIGSSSYAWGQVCINNINTNSIACENIRARGTMREYVGFPSNGVYEVLELVDFDCVFATTFLSECSRTPKMGSGDCGSADVMPNCTTLPSPEISTIANTATIQPTSLKSEGPTVQTENSTNSIVISQNLTNITLIPEIISTTTDANGSSSTPSSFPPSNAAIFSSFLPILIGGVVGSIFLLTLALIGCVVLVLVLITARKIRKRKVRYDREEQQDGTSINYETADPDMEQEYSNRERSIHRVISISAHRRGSRYVPLAPMEVLSELEAWHSLRSVEPPEEEIYDQVVHQSDMIVPSNQDREYGSLNNSQHVSQENENIYLQFNTELPCFIYQNDAEFWKPDGTETGIYSQMAQKRYREINPNELIRKELLGEGNFGYVHNGVWRSQKGEIPVAIKSIKGGNRDSNIGLLQEAAILGQFNHPNVLKLLGVVTIAKPMLMVTELMRAGLPDFLDIINHSNTIPSDKLAGLFLRFTLEIANGMEHLASKKYVHRDLAARNILVSHSISCKIGDFGLARGAGDDNEYYVSKGGLIPVKWTAPEAIIYKKYSEKSDVFSYGVTLFEIWSIGKPPWENVANEIVAQKVIKGEIMPPPTNCPMQLYQLMVSCWHPTKDERPAFNEIVSLLQNSTDILKRDTTANSNSVGHKRKVFKELQEIYLKSNIVYFDI